MGMVANEPSMEDILSSIKRIIADGSDRTPPARAGKRRPAAVGVDSAEPAAGDDDSESTILELTDAVSDEANALDEGSEPMTTLRSVADPVEPEPDVQAESHAPPAPADAGNDAALQLDAGMISDRSAQAARQSLSHLSALLIRPEDGESNTLEGMVREMLKPMLKQWLDERLPELVEVMVKKEIDRITGRLD